MITPQFITTGKAVFTATNTKRNTRLTFKVEKPDTFRGEFFAAVMKGPDNDYTYVGMVKEGSLFLRETKGSKYRAGTPEFDGLKLVLDIVAGRRPETPLLEIAGSVSVARGAKSLKETPESLKETPESLKETLDTPMPGIEAVVNEPEPPPLTAREVRDRYLRMEAASKPAGKRSLLDMARELDASTEDEDELKALVGF